MIDDISFASVPNGTSPFPGMAAITVRDRTSKDNPIVGAIVRFYIPAVVNTPPTNADGNTISPFLPAGTYAMSVSKKGYKKVHTHVVIYPNTVSYYLIRLKAR